jgi:hypothetical protein
MPLHTKRRPILEAGVMAWLMPLASGFACSHEGSAGDESGTGSAGSSTGSDGPMEGTAPHNSTGPTPGTPGAANEYSWDGSWSPTPGDFPLAGLTDPDPTQQGLPPGHWGWDGVCDCAGNEGTAIYDNEFVAKGLDFEPLLDSAGRHFGWRLIDTDGGTTELDHRGDAFDGSDGVDLFDLDVLQGTGPGENTPGINLGEGPDMLRYQTGWSADLRTGATDRGALFDNDLVILGSEEVLGANEYDIHGTTIHTGPGSDLVFVRNFGPAAIDLGNGASGRTDTLDEADGDDTAVVSGNARDFRIYGGYGNDTFIWYVDEVDDDRFLGPSFYGGGGWGEAVWGDPGTDRLVLVVEPDIEIVRVRGDHDDNPGSLLSFVYADYAPSIDAPTEDDEFARYYGLAEVGPGGEHTVTISYRSPDGRVFTQDSYITAVEEIQLGVGDSARVYVVDQVSGQLIEDPTLHPLAEVPERTAFDELFLRLGVPGS